MRHFFAILGVRGSRRAAPASRFWECEAPAELRRLRDFGSARLPPSCAGFAILGVRGSRRAAPASRFWECEAPAELRRLRDFGSARLPPSCAGVRLTEECRAPKWRRPIYEQVDIYVHSHDGLGGHQEQVTTICRFAGTLNRTHRIGGRRSNVGVLVMEQSGQCWQSDRRGRP